MLILLLGVFISAHTVRAVVLSSRRTGSEIAVHKRHHTSRRAVRVRLPRRLCRFYFYLVLPQKKKIF